MKIGIVGFAQSGKTTLFNALTGMNIDTSSYSGQDSANIGMARVPDERIEKLTEIFQPKKKTLAAVEYVDIAGIASSEPGDRTSGIPSEQLGRIRNNDMIVAVLRGFENDTVPHPAGSVDALRDMSNLWSEFLLSDHAICEGRIERLAAAKKKPNFTDENEKELAILHRCKALLDEEKPLRHLELADEEARLIRGFQFLTQKPLLIAVNIDERHIGNDEAILAKWAEWSALPAIEVIIISAKAEAEIQQLDEEEATMFRQELGLTEPVPGRIAAACYRLLGYHSFFTVGEDEVRAWSIPVGTNARAAAGEIHKDIERGFIRAEVVTYDKFVANGTLNDCKKDGSLRLEGKEYIVKDGEIVHYRFSV